ncbi:hypothetical protein QE152_g23135 [Popillia japonica]|uniref:Uncharacterized protein n=1 Tax=Popillia japonica TaxID=7064 RepID=A0AAW1KIG3_POPJA
MVTRLLGVIGWVGAEESVGVVYRPPHIDYKMFLNSLGDTLVECMALADVVYFCGDVNIDLLNIDSSSTAYLCDFIESLNFVQLIEQPTRAAGTSISLIDHIYVADSERVRDCGVIEGKGLWSY